MKNSRIGLLVDSSGVVSVSLLAADEPGRLEAVKLFATVREHVETFSRAIKVSAQREAVERAQRPARKTVDVTA